MGSRKKKTTSSETAVTTPNTPDYVSAPVQNYYNSVSSYAGKDPYSFVTPANSLQNEAFEGAGNLSTSPLFGQAADSVQSLMGRSTPFAGFGTASLGTLGPAGQASATGYTAPQLGAASRASATGYTAPQLGDAARVNPASLGTASQVNLGGYGIGNLGQAFGYGADQAGPIGLSGKASQANAASLLDGFQNYLNPATGQLVDTTLSNFDRNADRSRAAMSAQAARGGAFGSSRYAIAQAETEQNLARERALTESGLRNNAWNAAAGLASTDAGFRQQTGLYNAGAQNQRDETLAGLNAQNSQFNAGQSNASRQFNAGAANDFALSRFGAETDANRFGADAANQGQQFNAGARNQFSLANAGFQQDANMANTAAQNQFGLARAGFEADASRFGADAANQASQFNAGQQNQFALTGAGMQADAARFGADAANQASQFNTGQANQFSLAGFDAANQNNQFNAGAYNQNQQFNADQQLAAQQQQLAAAQQLAGIGGMMGDEERANLLAQLQAGGSLWDIQNANTQAPLTQLLNTGGLLDPSLIAQLTGQTINSNGTSTTKSSGSLFDKLASVASLGSAFFPAKR